MNYQHLNSNYVEPEQPYPVERNYSSTATPPTTAGASQVTVLHDPQPGRQADTTNEQLYESQHARLLEQPLLEEPEETLMPSPQARVVSHARAPASSSPSEPEIYGPDRFWGQQRLDQQPQQRPTPYRARVPVNPSQNVRFDEQESEAAAPRRNWAAASSFGDELARNAGAVTPGVDDLEYIQYALDALTRPRNGEEVSDDFDAMGSIFHPMPGATLAHPSRALLPGQWPLGHEPTEGTGLMNPDEELQRRRQRRRASTESTKVPPATEPVEEWRMSSNLKPPGADYSEVPSRQASALFLARGNDEWQPRSDVYDDPEQASRNPRLNYKPWLLQTPSLVVMASLWVLMIVALIFAAVWSSRHNGLQAYSGTIYGGQYFLFRILPQFVAGLLLIFAQCVITAAYRVLPFSAMTSRQPQYRRNVGFLPLYPKSFLWPQLVSTWQIWLPILATWLLNITIPLQSCLFTLIYVDGVFYWATVQGVAWTLVALYAIMAFSTVVMIVYWHGRRTGMIKNWDLKTLADIIFLVSQSNSLEDYKGTEMLGRRSYLRHALEGNIPRLGYWSTHENPTGGFRYSIGVPTSEKRLDLEEIGEPIHEKKMGRPRDYLRSYTSSEFDEQIAEEVRIETIRYRYLPWCLRNVQVISFAAVGTLLLVALLVVSFHPTTNIRNGFLPLVSAVPQPGAFSPANFLYSFVPSLVGMLLFLAFQSLDMTLRVLAPWGELQRKEGSRARTSLLLDYASCLPWEVTIKAIRNHHWRLAFVSFLTPLFLLLPVLGGGLFIALTTPVMIVRMYPNGPVFAILLALLILYVLGLMSLIPDRKRYRLPHAVTCLSEIISFCANEELHVDRSFEFARSKEELKEKLGFYYEWKNQPRWYFGTGFAKSERLGIKRLDTLTAKPEPTRRFHLKTTSDVGPSAEPIGFPTTGW